MPPRLELLITRVRPVRTIRPLAPFRAVPSPQYLSSRSNMPGGTVVSTSQAPAAIGPYSQAIKTDSGFVYTSGAIPLDPSGNLVGAGDVEAQTEQALKNLEAVLTAADASFATVIKTTVFIKDMGQFSLINAVYERMFGAHKPARSCVEVARLPKDVLVEIEAVALASSKR